MKIRYIISIVLIIVIILWLGLTLLNPFLMIRPAIAKVGESIEIDIQSPHPYPNGNNGRVLVWTDNIGHPNTTSIQLHFNRIDILGKFETPTVYEEVDYGECDLNAPPGYIREWDGKNMITQKQIVEGSDGDEIGIGGISMIKCGIMREKKEFTPQEMFDNHLNWAEGDFLAIKNANGIVIDIINGNSFGKYEAGQGVIYKKEDVWSKIYPNTNQITLELYADETENGYGLSIDKYRREFTQQEIEDVN